MQLNILYQNRIELQPTTVLLQTVHCNNGAALAMTTQQNIIEYFFYFFYSWVSTWNRIRHYLSIEFVWLSASEWALFGRWRHLEITIATLYTIGLHLTYLENAWKWRQLFRGVCQRRHLPQWHLRISGVQSRASADPPNGLFAVPQLL